ncbi:hypothetical protein [Actinomadura madurae]|uniref:hypothetical protein n=1 Tax=Actinomadura madurae TaxID=1993 RepID=UPI0020D2488F|nr:hypothetical protein [Actinomadura madurae]MCP9984153.1 hypothetical protein [Actinomadura madurae]
MNESVEVRRGRYHDSVTLMRVSRLLSERPGVAAAMVAMGTGLNREMFGRMGFEVPGEAGPDDLVVAIRVEDGGLDEAREALDGLLREAARPPSGGGVLGAPEPPGRRGRRRPGGGDGGAAVGAGAAGVPGGDGRAGRRPQRDDLQ